MKISHLRQHESSISVWVNNYFLEQEKFLKHILQ